MAQGARETTLVWHSFLHLAEAISIAAGGHDALTVGANVALTSIALPPGETDHPLDSLRPPFRVGARLRLLLVGWGWERRLFCVINKKGGGVDPRQG